MHKTTDQPKITNRQQEILLLLYKFRFLNRTQIQTLLNHKYKSLVQIWLNELVKQKLIVQYYNNKIAANPAVYALDKDGRRFLKNDKEVNIEALNRVWREKNYSYVFRDHCQFVGDIYLSLQNYCTEMSAKLIFRTKTEMYGVEHFIKPGPDAYVSIEYAKDDIKRYFLDIFDDIPPVAMRKRIKELLSYYESDEWQDNTEKEFPEIILICPNHRIKSHLFHFIKNKLREDVEPIFYLAIKDAVVSKGLSRETLQKVKTEE